MYANPRVRRASDQSDGNMEFNGRGQPVSYRELKTYSGNAANLTAKTNYGPGPTRGNTGKPAGPAAPIAQSHRVDANSINLGAGPRNAGGTAEARCPTNPDHIRMKSGPRKGNQQ